MTPKEKAEELINKFNPVSRIYPTFVEDEFVLTNDAKECALITIDEILSLFINDCEDLRFYKEVKQEIEKL